MIKYLLLALGLLSASLAQSASVSDALRAAATDNEQEEFLRVDEAFQGSVARIDDKLLIRYQIAPKYYLYRDPFRLEIVDGAVGKPRFPEGILKNDEFLGEQIVYFNFVEFSVPIERAQIPFTLNITFQGCAEAGLCYPPTTREFVVDSGAPVGSVTTASDNESSDVKNTGVKSSETELAERLGGDDLLWQMLLFLGLGIGLTFTPCVLPMVPIVASIIGASGQKLSTARAFTLSLVYVQAVAIVYAALGLAVSSAGAALTGYLQSPWVIIPAIVVFVALAFSMFGAYELQLPSSLQEKLMGASNQQQGGSLLGVAVMGALSALIVSPCVSAPLTGALVYIAQSGDLLKGALTLYALGLGMGMPLMLVGMGGAKLLPKAGAWMEQVKYAFGFMLIGVAVVLVNRLIPAEFGLLSWGLFVLAAAAWLGQLSIKSAWQFWIQGLRIALLVYGVVLIIGASAGQTNPLKPLPNFAASASAGATKTIDAHAGFKLVKTVADLEQEIAAANTEGKTVMLDFFADWCVACFEFADYTFPDPAVQQALSNTVLLQADVTANDAADRELMARYDILGLPSILFFNEQGEELRAARVTGFMKAEPFARHINDLHNR